MLFENVPRHDQANYHLVAFNENGDERREQNGPYSLELMRAAQERDPSDVFVFSHGWNGDVPAAKEQYSAWIATMLDRADDRARADELAGGFRPLLVGLHWPSKAWGDEQLGRSSFSVATGMSGMDADEGDDVEDLVRTLASRPADTPAPPDPVRTILPSPVSRPLPD